MGASSFKTLKRRRKRVHIQHGQFDECHQESYNEIVRLNRARQVYIEVSSTKSYSQKKAESSVMDSGKFAEV